MRLPKRGERGFTLIELLIVVAILGVLAAVVIPNVTRFVGSGEEEAAETELHNIQLAVTSMMLENGITSIPNPVLTATSDMGAFPDTASKNTDGPDVGDDFDKEFDPDGDPYTFTATGDKPGYLLWGHDMLADTQGMEVPLVGPLVNYVVADTTQNLYTCDSDGTVHQVLP